MRNLLLGLAAVAAALFSLPAQAETINCTEITALPATITTQGVYCFKGNLTTAITSGNAITIAANNVTIDMNGFKLGGQAAGAGTTTIGFYALDRTNFTLRNGNIRGFQDGIFLAGGSGHLLEDLRFDRNTEKGLWVQGNHSNIIRNNQILNTGSGANSVSAIGIYLVSVSNTLVENNVVSRVSETTTVRGIYLSNVSTLVELRNNSIYDMIDAVTKRGIAVNNSNDITVFGNKILNQAGTGTQGIVEASSTGLNCIDNIIAGYTTSTTGCDYLAGNHTP